MHKFLKSQVILFFFLVSYVSTVYAYKSWPKHPQGLDKKAYLKEYSKAVSIGIETPGSSGSGVIIGRKKNQYLFITTRHVAQSQPIKNEEYWIYSVMNERNKIKVKRFIYPKEFEGYDLALGVFESDTKFPVAYILKKLVYNPNFNFCSVRDLGKNIDFFSDGYQGYLECDNEWQILGKPIIGGVSLPTKALNIPIFRTSSLKMLTRAKGNQQGYEAVYEASSTVPGMSGGGVFGQRSCGGFSRSEKIIEYYDDGINGKMPLEKEKKTIEFTGLYGGIFAIHGMSEEYSNTSSRSGVGLGIPLDLFSGYFNKISKEYGILKNRSSSFFNC